MIVPAPVTSQPPVLVTPHRCPRCTEPITEVAGVPHRTITHQCGARVSLYAVHFHTPCCGHSVEVPQSTAGRTLNCPNCQAGFVSPYADILHRRMGDVEAGEVMRWTCTECDQELQCNIQARTGQPVAGRPVVCTACRTWQLVPAAGRRVTSSS